MAELRSFHASLPLGGSQVIEVLVETILLISINENNEKALLTKECTFTHKTPQKFTQKRINFFLVDNYDNYKTRLNFEAELSMVTFLYCSTYYFFESYIEDSALSTSG